jgi:hypothetical protein
VTRPNPITLGVLALAVAVLGAGIYLVVRPHHPAVAPTAEDPAEELLRGAPPAPPAPAPERLIRPRPPISRAAPRAAPPPAAEPAPVEAAAQPAAAAAAASAASAAALKKRELREAAHHLQLRQAADEQLFESRNIPEAARAAIRKLNQEQGEQAQAFLNAQPAELGSREQINGSLAHNGDAERARWTSLSDLLGADAAKDFTTAESVAARKLRTQYRQQWADEDAAAAPPRPPPAAPP